MDMLQGSESAISAITWPSGKEASTISVLALDVSINGLYNLISKTRVGANGMVFLFEGDTSVYHPANKETATGNNRFSTHHTDVASANVRDAHFANDVRCLISQGEGATLEFKSTLRMNIKTGKNDKSIEMAWMKSVSALMNTSGGMIVLGVNVNGKVIGTALDGFENQDKCRLHFTKTPFQLPAIIPVTLNKTAGADKAGAAR